MSWLKPFIKILKKIWKHRKIIIEIATTIATLGPKVKKWWNGKKIAVLGPTAVGKNSFYHRLKDEPIPKQHFHTKGAERIPTFNFKCTLPDGKTFEIKCKRSMNIGGETDERERYWLDACKDSDVIFYMITLQDLNHRDFNRGSRIYDDIKWLSSNFVDFKPNTVVHFLVNKIDEELLHSDEYAEYFEKLMPAINEFEAVAKKTFGDYEKRITGISPISLKDDAIFSIAFPRVLNAVYEALHNEKS